MRTSVRAPGASRPRSRTCVEHARVAARRAARPAARSDVGEVQLAAHRRLGDPGDLVARSPACAASSSITSPWISVESTSITTSRLARRCRPPRCTATSTCWSAASAASAARSASGSAPDTSQLDAGHRLVRRAGRSGRCWRRAAAIRPAIAGHRRRAAAGCPSTVTCSRPRRRAAARRSPVAISTSMPEVGGDRSRPPRRDRCQVGIGAGEPTRTPRTSRPRMTTCSTSSDGHS